MSAAIRNDAGVGGVGGGEARFNAEIISKEKALLTTAVDALKSLPRFKGHIFTTTGGARPLSGFMRMERRLDD